ncbi:MAG: Hpt domain-containing protein [Betaproteobacteria bacterium]
MNSTSTKYRLSRLHAHTTGLDLDVALDRLGGNVSLLADLLQRFATEHQAGADEIDALVNAQRPSHAVEALHRLKGAARIVGAFVLADAAQRAEDALLRGDSTPLAGFRVALHEAVDGAWACAPRKPLR